MNVCTKNHARVLLAADMLILVVVMRVPFKLLWLTLVPSQLLSMPAISHSKYCMHYNTLHDLVAVTIVQLYRNGIYDEEDCSSEDLDHGVLVVGYGEDDDEAYWLVKNR